MYISMKYQVYKYALGVQRVKLYIQLQPMGLFWQGVHTTVTANYVPWACHSSSPAPALAVSINIASNQSTTMYSGMAVAFWCNVGYSSLTGAERFLWRSSCMRDCTVWGQTTQLVTIDSLKPSDSGNYSCTVTRADVSRSASVIINVIGKSRGTYV